MAKIDKLLNYLICQLKLYMCFFSAQILNNKYELYAIGRQIGTKPNRAASKLFELGCAYAALSLS